MHNKFLKKYYFINRFDPRHLSSLDKNIALIYRNYTENVDENLIIKIKKFCKKKGIKIFLSNNFRLAIKLDLDGVYLPSFNKDLRQLTKDLVSDIGGWFVVLKGVLKAIPFKIKIIFTRVPGVKKKWPYDGVTQKMLSQPIANLRKEYGIKILNK